MKPKTELVNYLEHNLVLKISLTESNFEIEGTDLSSQNNYAGTWIKDTDIDYEGIYELIKSGKAIISYEAYCAYKIKCGFNSLRIFLSKKDELAILKAELSVLKSKMDPWCYKHIFTIDYTVHADCDILREISKYTKDVEVPHDLSMLHITMHIPCCGNYEAQRESVIVLAFGGTHVCKSVIFSETEKNYLDINLSGVVVDISKSSYKLTVLASCSGGTLLIPNCGGKIKSVPATLYMIGYKK